MKSDILSYTDYTVITPIRVGRATEKNYNDIHHYITIFKH